MCCEVGSGVGTNLGERGDDLSVWTCSSLVGVAEDIGVGSEMQGIEVRGRAIMGGGRCWQC